MFVCLFVRYPNSPCSNCCHQTSYGTPLDLNEDQERITANNGIVEGPFSNLLILVLLILIVTYDVKELILYKIKIDR